MTGWFWQALSAFAVRYQVAWDSWLFVLFVTLLVTLAFAARVAVLAKRGRRRVTSPAACGASARPR